MKAIHIYKVAVYTKGGEDLNADEIREAIRTELDGTYYLSVVDVEWQGKITTDQVEIKLEKEGN
jgi:hypothetical protein